MVVWGLPSVVGNNLGLALLCYPSNNRVGATRTTCMHREEARHVEAPALRDQQALCAIRHSTVKASCSVDTRRGSANVVVEACELIETPRQLRR